MYLYFTKARNFLKSKFYFQSFTQSIICLNGINLLFLIACYVDLVIAFNQFEVPLDVIIVLFIINMLSSNGIAVFTILLLKEDNHVIFKYSGLLSTILTIIWFGIISLMSVTLIVLSFLMNGIITSFVCILYLIQILALIRPSVKNVLNLS